VSIHDEKGTERDLNSGTSARCGEGSELWNERRDPELFIEIFHNISNSLELHGYRHIKVMPIVSVDPSDAYKLTYDLIPFHFV